MNGFITAKKGFILVEVMVVVTLLALVFGAIFSLYFFGVNSFVRGTVRTDIQQNVRVAASYIIQEIRFANSLKVLNEGVEGSPGNEIEYTKPGDPSNRKYKIKRNIKNEVVLLTITGSLTSSNIIAYGMSELSFERGLEHTLEFALTGTEGGQDFRVQGAIRPRNL